MKTKEEVLAILEKLGMTKEDVANKLYSLNIKGDRKQCSFCPIAKYLVKNEVAVGVGVGVGVTMYWYSISKYPQLRGVRDFILAFDQGEFPQLEG